MEKYLLSSTSVLPAPGNDPKSKMVMSRSSPTPHFVRVISSGQYVCDKQCLQWSSSMICSHILVAAEVNGELLQFLQWYVQSNQEPNITKLANMGLPSGRGRKGGVPKRKRGKSKADTPDIIVKRPATRPQPLIDSLTSMQPTTPGSPVHPHGEFSEQGRKESESTHGAKQVGTTTVQQITSTAGNTQQTASLVQFRPSAKLIPGSSVAVSPLVHSSMISGNAQVMQAVAFGGQQLVSPGQRAASSSSTSPTHLSGDFVAPNTNPFYIRFIEGNIRMCQGCRSFLRNVHGVVPAPPFNLCAARAERRSYRNAAGVLVTPHKEQPAHYHLNLACIQAVAPQFVPSSLVVPSDIRPKLTQTHLEYLKLVFGLS